MTRQRGFGAVAAIVVLVILAALAAAVLSIGSSQQLTSAQDVLSARAWQAARAGNEWGLYRALRSGGAWNGAACDWNLAADTPNTQSATLDLTAAGMRVTVSCDSWLYEEGESAPGASQQVRVYRITAVACPAATCPAVDAATVAAPGYVERTRVVLATN